MKKSLYIILGSVLLLFAVAGCHKQDDTYSQFVKAGGYVYPGRSAGFTAQRGYNRVVVSWPIPYDPAVEYARVYWDNYLDSVEVKYSQFAGQDTASISIPGLSARSYTFDIVNFDKDGHKSMAVESSATPYDEAWLVTRADRSVVSTEMVKNEKTGKTDAIVTMTASTDQMVATLFRYIDNDERIVELEVPMLKDTNKITLPDALKDKRFEYKSLYCPEGAADTVAALNWTKSVHGITYQPDASGWACTYTANQLRSPYKVTMMFDGITDDPNNRYFSSNSTAYRAKFPKIIAVDTKVEAGQEYTFTNFTLYQHPDTPGQRYVKGVKIYIGDEPYNPNAGSSYATSFGDPAIEMTLTKNGDAVQNFVLPEAKSGRYFAIVFTNSFNSTGFIDVWEFAPFGYIAGLAD